jgi:hypothetical protein
MTRPRDAGGRQGGHEIYTPLDVAARDFGKALRRSVRNAFEMLEKGRVAASGNREDLPDELIHRHLAV